MNKELRFKILPIDNELKSSTLNVKYAIYCSYFLRDIK